MTEKRFEIIKSKIIDGARVIKDNENKYTFATTFETATLINYRKALNELHEENEQLKSDNNRLVNETAKIVAEHQRKVLDLIDKRIDKCEPIDYARNIEGDVPVFDCETATEIRVLNELKKELEND